MIEGPTNVFDAMYGTVPATPKIVNSVAPPKASVPPKVIAPPKEFVAECAGCKASFTYTYLHVEKRPNGTRRWTKQYKYGLDCPCCHSFFEHSPDVYKPSGRGGILA